MKQILIKKKKIVVEDVPVPLPGPGEILVKVVTSCLSPGTEIANLKASSRSIFQRALDDPKKLKKIYELFQNKGYGVTKREISSKLINNVQPLGYSVSGEVVAVGSQVSEFSVGDNVACAGSKYAFHAEFIVAPSNLAIKIPKNVSFVEASTITIGIIALHGVRRLNPTIGETFIVFGLGLIGQITAQILKANGCRVIGIDSLHKRIANSYDQGIDQGFLYENVSVSKIKEITEGHGVDGVVITAASKSSDIIGKAFEYTRKKGRVVIVGDVGLNLRRSDFYEKEIDIYISSSYGPGRYEAKYEEGGLDYPISYVRWTENRNMHEFLRLLSTKQIKIEKLSSKVFDVKNASEAYKLIGTMDSPTLIFINYLSSGEILRTINLNKPSPFKRDKLNLAIIGAGDFVKTAHLPNLKKLNAYFNLDTIVTKNGYNAVKIAEEHKFNSASTDYNEVIQNTKIDAVIIATRHNLHSSIVEDCVKAKKHIFVEKPMVVNRLELESLENLIIKSKYDGILMTGFNRRFSPHAKYLASLIENSTDQRSNFILNYRMNAGFIPYDHWVHSSEGGGRNIGEACHIYDLFTFLAKSKVKKISVSTIEAFRNFRKNDNFIATLEFESGAVANLTYTSMGNTKLFKERAEIFCGDTVAVMEDFRNIKSYAGKVDSFSTKFQEKGLLEELEFFYKGIKDSYWPISWDDQRQVSNISFDVEELILKLK